MALGSLRVARSSKESVTMHFCKLSLGSRFGQKRLLNELCHGMNPAGVGVGVSVVSVAWLPIIGAFDMDCGCMKRPAVE